jgi:hypothetical protein
MRSGVGLRPEQPERPEGGKFLAGGQRSVDRQPARGQPVDLPGTDQAEVRCPEKHDHLVEIFRPVQWIVQAKAREAEVTAARVGQALGLRLIAEQVGVEGELPHLAVINHEHPDRMREQEAGMEELRLKAGLSVPESGLGTEADRPVLVVGHLPQGIREDLGRRLIRGSGLRPSQFRDLLEQGLRRCLRRASGLRRQRGHRGTQNRQQHQCEDRTHHQPHPGPSLALGASGAGRDHPSRSGRRCRQHGAGGGMAGP